MSQPVIQFAQIQKAFDTHVALQSIDFSINNGEFVTILGPSGCGKTTLLRMLAGFETPDAGQLLLNGVDVSQVPPEKRRVNMVFQSYALFPHMTVFDNIAFGLRCDGMQKDQIAARVNEALERVHLEKYAQRKPHQLSGGQQQRVAIARAIVNEPEVLLLDEPLSALDYHLRQKMRIELKQLQRRLGITFIFVTHDREEALSLADRVIVMNEGRIEQMGAPRDIYEEPVNLFVAQFVGDTNIFRRQIEKADHTSFVVDLVGHHIEFKQDGRWQEGDWVNIVFRPEDISVWGINEIERTEDILPGQVSEVIYKGNTVDLMVTLENGKTIFATEFFDDDDEYLEYQIGEKVLIKWQLGWEVVLPDE